VLWGALAGIHVLISLGMFSSNIEIFILDLVVYYDIAMEISDADCNERFLSSE